MTSSPDDRAAQVDDSETTPTSPRTPAKKKPAAAKASTTKTAAAGTKTAAAAKSAAAKKPAAAKSATAKKPVAAKSATAKKPAATKSPAVKKAAPAKKPAAKSSTSVTAAARTEAALAAAEKAAPTGEVVVEPLPRVMSDRPTPKTPRTAATARTASAARTAAARNTAAHGAGAKSTASSSRSAASKTSAAKTSAAKAAAAKSAAAKSSARAATAKTAAAKTAAAKTAAAKTAAAKAEAAKAEAAKAEAAKAEAAKAEAANAAPVEADAEVLTTDSAQADHAQANAVQTADEVTPMASEAGGPARVPEVEEPAREEDSVQPDDVESPSPTADADMVEPVVVEEPASADVDAAIAVEVVEAVVGSDDAAPAVLDALDASSGNEAISIRGLVKHFGDNRAVDGIDLTVPAGSFYGVVGPNGAGKTTTLSIVAGLLRADAGTVRICGIDQATQPQAAKRLMGVLPDRLRTFDRLTGRQLLYYYGLLRGLASDVIEKRAADLARAFDLGDALSRVVSDYSAGMTKKIMLAGAMIHSPRVLVLDEPFESVDPVSSAVILDILRAYVSHGGTVILSSHGMDLVERVCSRVAIIVGGEVLAEGTIDEVRAGQTLEARFVELAGSSGEVEGLEWLHTFSD